MVGVRPGHAPQPERVAAADPAAVEVAYFTDPLCCWSWAVEPHWRRVRMHFGARVTWRHRLGGLLPSWRSFTDPVNDVARAAQMAPYWLHVRREAGVPLAAAMWHDDPPDSSWPASMAVAAAGLQGEAAGERMLRRIREACVLEGRNVARREVLRELAAECELDLPVFDEATGSGGASARFEQDLRETRYLRIGRFPSFVLGCRSGRRMLVTGFRPAALLAAAVAHALGEPEPHLAPVEPDAYLERWGRATRWELAAACELHPVDVARRLAHRVRIGDVEVLDRPAAGDVVFRLRHQHGAAQG